MAEEAGPKRGEKKRQAAIRRLLDQGLALMAERGVIQCRVEEITQAAGVGKGSFFTYFHSKEAFVARLTDRVLNDLARRVMPMGLTPTDAESLLAGVGAVHLRYFQLRPQTAAFLIQAAGLAGEQGPAREVGERLAAHVDMLAEKIGPAGEGLGWPRERARELALMIFATSLGYFWMGTAVNLGADTPVNLLDRLGRALAKGLAE